MLLPNYLLPSNFPTKTLYTSSKLPLFLKLPYENPVFIFQITSFPQISPTKPFMLLPNYLFPSNFPMKTLYTSSKLPLALKFPHENPVFIFQITSFPQISTTKPFMLLPNYLFPSNFPMKTLYSSSKLPLSLKFPYENPLSIFQIISFPQISPTKPFMSLPNYNFPSNFPMKTLYTSSKLSLFLKSPHQNSCMHMSFSPYVPHLPPISFC